jgi:hypothetical protein
MTPWKDASGYPTSSIYITKHTPGENCSSITGLAGFKMEMQVRVPPADARGSAWALCLERHKHELEGLLVAPSGSCSVPFKYPILSEPLAGSAPTSYPFPTLP